MLWIAAGLVGLVAVAPELDRAVKPQAVSAPGGFVIPRAPDGQFYLEATIGSDPVRFLVDRSGDGVLLAGADAQRLGIEVKPGFATVTLLSLVLGTHQVGPVEVVIAPDLPVSLIGQSFLARLGAAEIERDRLVLR